MQSHTNPARLSSQSNLLSAEQIVKKHDEIKQKEEAATKLAKQLAELPPGEQQIIMFGERLWPRPVGAFYDYYQLRTAIWYFNDHNRWLGMNHDNGVDSRARLLRLGTYYLRTFVHHELKGHDGEAMENLFNVTMKLALLMERNPHGECIYPPTPNIEGEEWAVKRRKRYSR